MCRMIPDDSASEENIKLCLTADVKLALTQLHL